MYVVDAMPKLIIDNVSYQSQVENLYAARFISLDVLLFTFLSWPGNYIAVDYLS